MYVTFTVIRDGTKTERPPMAFKLGTMANMMNKAAQGVRISNVLTKLSRHA